MKAHSLRRHPSIAILFVPLICLLAAQGCTESDNISDLGLLPAGHDTWVEIVNDESEARTIYQKRLRDFQGRSMQFVTRLVQGTKHSR